MTKEYLPGYMRCSDWCCVVTEKDFDVTLHRLWYPLIRPWQCQICQLRFTDEEEVGKHVRKDPTHLQVAKDKKQAGQQCKVKETTTRSELYKIALKEAKLKQKVPPGITEKKEGGGGDR